MNTQISQKGGQVLLIVIMVVATLLTVVLSLVFKSQTETQITHLEEQNQKALAAAEAAIDTALKQQSNISFGSNSNFLTNFQGYTGQATLSTNIKNTFVSPLLQPDEQYTYYLVTYDPAAAPASRLGSDYYTGGFTIYFGTTASTTCASRNTPALELTYISANPSAPPAYTVTKRLAEPCITGKIVGSPDISVTSLANSPEKVESISYYFKTSSLTAPANTKLVIIRPLFSSTKIGVIGTNLKPQGQYVTSSAQTPDGIEKKVQLFQSFPQIPAEFFLTSF